MGGGIVLHKNVLQIRDENGIGNIINELKLSFDRIEVSVRDIITERVIQEVALYNQKSADYQYALVKPTEQEKVLNGPRSKRKPVDVEKQIEVALQAFEGNGFFILIDDNQAESLDEVVVIRPDTVVSFIKLTPLVGG